MFTALGAIQIAWPLWQTSTLSVLLPQRTSTTVSVTLAVPVQPEELVAVTM